MFHFFFFFKCQDKISLSRVKTNLVLDRLSVSQTMDSYANRQEKQLISLAQFDTFFVKSGRKRVFSSDRHDSLGIICAFTSLLNYSLKNKTAVIAGNNSFFA